MVTYRRIRRQRILAAMCLVCGAVSVASTLWIGSVSPSPAPTECRSLSSPQDRECVAASAQSLERGALASLGLVLGGASLLVAGSLAALRTASLSVEEVVARTMTPMSKIRQMVATGRLTAYRDPEDGWRVLRRSVRDLS
ncbi:MAG: hypothetical protein QOH26_1700 [Actinomycetota bacterium]|jgi:hypothetical protein|nr:hypothetical protein [Actinomycetota bacterium]